MIDNRVDGKRTVWRLEEKGRGPATIDSLAARDLPCGRTLKKKNPNLKEAVRSPLIALESRTTGEKPCEVGVRSGPIGKEVIHLA